MKEDQVESDAECVACMGTTKDLMRCTQCRKETYCADCWKACMWLKRHDCPLCRAKNWTGLSDVALWDIYASTSIQMMTPEQHAQLIALARGGYTPDFLELLQALVFANEDLEAEEPKEVPHILMSPEQVRALVQMHPDNRDFVHAVVSAAAAPWMHQDLIPRDEPCHITGAAEHTVGYAERGFIIYANMLKLAMYEHSPVPSCCQVGEDVIDMGIMLSEIV